MPRHAYDGPPRTRVEQLVRSTGLRQKQIAAELGISPASLRYWCAGSVRMRTDSAELLGRYFGVGIQELLGPPLEVSAAVFDIEDIYPDCTVQVLRNSVTGEVSVGWWENERE